MTETQSFPFKVPFDRTEVFTLEITPIWKWEGDEYLMELSAALIADEEKHILFENSIPIDFAL